MIGRNSFASASLACLLAVGFLGIASGAGAAPVWQPGAKPGDGARSSVVDIRHRRRGRPLYLPIGPSYLAYDYPYYYSRGFYPKHIGAGYVYYGYPYAYYRKIYRSRCSYQRRRCIAHARHKRWSARRQRRACRCR
jgi:hypothetical protein